MTYQAVEDAVKLVSNILEANHITETNETIRNRVYGWYCNSDCADYETLAACALNGDYYPEATYIDMLRAKEYWFPQALHDETGIWDIEMAQQDMKWW